MALLVSAVGMLLGGFCAIAPARAVRIWGAERFRQVGAQHEASFTMWFRVFGILLWVGAALVGLECILGECR